MSILIDKNTKYLIQGITGKEGRRALRWMSRLDAKVLAGVTPGKGGQVMPPQKNRNKEDLVPITVFESVAEAVENYPEINATAIYVPPKFVLNATKEAIAANIPLIHIIAEGVPTQDTAILFELVRQKNNQGIEMRVIGPSSIGIMSPGKSVLGSIGSGKDDSVLIPYSDNVTVNKQKGGVVILSKSGGMSLTIANVLAQNGIAQSTMVGLGGDKFIATNYSDLLSLIEQDNETWAVVIIGEIGGSYEEDLAKEILDTGFSKPVVAFVSGRFAENLPTGVSFGHAGAIVSKKIGTRLGKISALKKAGVLIADNPADIVELLKNI